MKINDKLVKSDLKYDFENSIFKSFSHEEKYEYNLFDLNDSEIKSVEEYIRSVNDSENYFLYYRGDSLKKFGKDYNDIVKFSLNKFFIVGFKGADFYRNEREKGYYNPFINEDAKYLEVLIKEIKKQFPNFSQAKLEKYPEKKLDILLALIHNSGEYFPMEKENSPLVSVAVANGNFDIAKIFSEIEDNEYGFIILGFEKLGKYYIDSELLKEFNIQKRGVIDFEQEMMIKKALWPSNIIGIFTLNKDEKNFIVNPWLLYKLKKGLNSESYLINVIQEDFSELSKDLGYSQYSTRSY